MKSLWICLLLSSLIFCGTNAFALDPGEYRFGGTITIEPIFATGDTGLGMTSSTGKFVIEELVVGAPDPVTGVQTIVGPGNPPYGMTVDPLYMIAMWVPLEPTGQIIGYIDNTGGNEDATVFTEAFDFYFGISICWNTEVNAPAGPAGTIMLKIPLNSPVIPEPPWFADYNGDPRATSFTATAEFDSHDGEYPYYTSVTKTGFPIDGEGYVKLVSPDAHFGSGLIPTDTISFTTYNGQFIQCTDEDSDGYHPEGGICGPIDCDDNAHFMHPGMTEVEGNGIDDDCNPNTPPDWQASASVVDAKFKISSDIANYLLLLIVPFGLVIAMRIRRRKKQSATPDYLY